MNAHVETLLAEAKTIATKLRESLAGIAAVQSTLKTVNTSRQSLQSELDQLVANGKFESDENAQKVSTLNSRLQLIPTRIKQLEEELAAKDLALKPLIQEAYYLINRFTTAARNYSKAQVEASVFQLVPAERRPVVENEISRLVDNTGLAVAVNGMDGSFTPLSLMSAKSFAPKTDHAIQVLEEKMPAIVAQYIVPAKA